MKKCFLTENEELVRPPKKFKNASGRLRLSAQTLSHFPKLAAPLLKSFLAEGSSALGISGQAIPATVKIYQYFTFRYSKKQEDLLLFLTSRRKRLVIVSS